MDIPKKYFHDRPVLFLLTVSLFAFVAGSLLTAYRLSGSQGALYSQYRSNLGLSGYIPGDTQTFILFIVFALLVFVFHAVMSVRVFHISKHLSRITLAMGVLLLVLVAVVSNALLGLK